MFSKKSPRLHVPFGDFVARINRYDLSYASDQVLPLLLRASIEAGRDTKSFAVLREIIRRETGLWLFDSQLAAARSMQLGHIAELPTGEGKTLAAALCAAVLAASGRRVHVLVFNSYLASRDHAIAQPIHARCGLTCACITDQTPQQERREAYGADVVYLPAKEAGFDYLRNFVADTKEQAVFPGFDAALVDEADSILIDEARIPLVLAGGAREERRQITRIAAAVSELAQQDVTVQEKKRRVWLTEAGIAHMEQLLGIENLYENPENHLLLPLLSAGLEARYLYQNGRDYIIKDRAVFVVDEPTGRIAKGRRFPDDLQRAVEAQEGLVKTASTRVLNSISIQAFLRQYPFLCGMTGTIATAKDTVWDMYERPVDVIPPHTPCIRLDHSDRVYLTDAGRNRGILAAIELAHEKGQPVLLGTQSVTESEQFSQLLEERGLSHVVLNARNDQQEAMLIAKAGEPGRITVSTNMAGRGVDIRLGGDDPAAAEAVRKAGGLLVLSAGINRSRRIDNQLRGRAGRQGDPGESCFFISYEQPMLRQFQQEATRLWNRSNRQKLARMPRWAQKETEGMDFETRRSLEKYSFLIEQQRVIMSRWRDALRAGEEPAIRLADGAPKRYAQCLEQVGEEAICRAECQLSLYYSAQHWADYLETMDQLRQSIHLSVIGGEDPLTVYNRAAIDAFDRMRQDIAQDVLQGLMALPITAEGIDMHAAGLCAPSSTWTYLIDDSAAQFSTFPALVKRLLFGKGGRRKP